MTLDQLLDECYIFPLLPGYQFQKGVSWQDTSALGKTIRKKYPADQLWGIDTEKSGLLVVDVDVKNGKQGLESLKRLPELPETFTVKTRSGGYHYYFKGSGRNSVQTKLGPGLDTRGAGGLVFVHKEVVCDAEIAPAPKWITEKLEEACSQTFDLFDCGFEEDLPQHLEAATRLILEFPPAVEGNGGDQHTLQLALKLRDLGISPDTAYELMLDHWNDRCDPPWDERELENKVRNAYKYGKNTPGSATLLGKLLISETVMRDVGLYDIPFKELPQETAAQVARLSAQEPEEDDDGPIQVSSLKCGEAPPMEWLIEGWIPLHCVASMYGPPGVGKSLLTIETCNCIASGADWYGARVRHPSPVLYVSCEDDTGEFYRRQDKLRRKQAHLPRAGKEHNFWFWDRVGKVSLLAAATNVGMARRDFFLKLEKKVVELGPKELHKVVVLDTISDMGELNENDRNQVNSFVKNVLGGFVTHYNCTVIFLAHPSKSSDFSGSTAWEASVRSMLHLKFHDTDRDLRWITRGKSNREGRQMTKEEGLLLRWHEGVFEQVDPASVEKELKAIDERAVFNVLRAACDRGEPLAESHNSPRYFKNYDYVNEKGCTVPPDQLKNILNRLKEDGRVRKEGPDLIAEDF